MGQRPGTLENLGMTSPGFWSGKRVLLTGHTGFKGGWLTLWLSRLGAQLFGFALAPPSEPNLFNVANLSQHIRSQHGDIADFPTLLCYVDRVQPDVVLHLAAQSLVRASYADPVGTFRTNVLGTVHVIEAARLVGSPKCILNVTSDKCYENRETLWAYRETDPMGGHDPYSSSKGCAELVASAYWRSFFQPMAKNGRQIGLASVRAGNVIGGGDWSTDRLVPDCMRALLACAKPVIRNPSAIRPWQHVLEPLSGYLTLVERLWEQPGLFAGAYNFGPHDRGAKPVSWIVERLCGLWSAEARYEIRAAVGLHEAHYLKLDSTLAREKLAWQPRLELEEALEMTIDWFRAYHSGAAMDNFTSNQIEAYERKS
jgi:CDP-glucose 4,6-dehydratase